MKVKIVIPTYNERENIRKLVPRIFGVFKKKRIKGSLVVVDDNSPDRTALEVKRMQKKYPIKLLERSRKLGLGSAYILGFNEALKEDTDIVFEMDADLSHDPNYIPGFIEKIKKGHDVAVGSRYDKGGGVIGWNAWRRLISFGGNFIGKKIAGIDVSDLTSGYRAYRSEVLRSVELDSVKSTGYNFQLEMLWRVIKRNYKVGIVPIVFRDRSKGRSKLSKIDIVNFFLTALKIRLNLL